ncbi:MAG TPA: HupE/UreJ family protein [Candidatus Acidoferrales bacterium]|nr:HupE/UreJ family protein [Candidatus Acidoferrales bacterium]
MKPVRPLHYALVLAALAPWRAAFAHSFAPAVLDLRERQPGIFDVVWKMPGAESGVLTPGDERVAPQFPSRCRRFEGGGASEDGSAYWRLDCGSEGLRGAQLSAGGLDGSRLDVIVRITWSDGTATSSVLRSGADTFVVPAQPAAARSGAAASAVLVSYGRLGVEHILFGFDHLMFVLGLLLLVDSWTLLLKTISAFTVAHSLALALAVLGVVTVPPAPVETLIALSIVLVALELTRAPDAPATLTRRYPWAVAFAFGLLHGLGFAGALAEIGLPPDQIPLALLSFNLGVELGQVMFVAAMLGPLLLFRRYTSALSRLRLVPAYAIGALAVAWTFERIQRFWM